MKISEQQQKEMRDWGEKFELAVRCKALCLATLSGPNSEMSSIFRVPYSSFTNPPSLLDRFFDIHSGML